MRELNGTSFSLAQSGQQPAQFDETKTNIDRSLGELPILSTTERDKILYDFNSTAAPYPHERLLHELFEEQVRRTPHATAVKYENQSLTYSDLNHRANCLARVLIKRRIGPDRLVGLYIERSPDMVIALLAILKAGGAFMPLDPNHPTERLMYMLKDAAPCLLLTQKKLIRALPYAECDVFLLDTAWSEIAYGDSENIDPHSIQLTSRHLAYVIYTSGSTGDPKGVEGEHRGMVNRIIAQSSIAPFACDDICCQKTSIGFVDAIFEILGPLSYGRPLVLASAAAINDVQELIALIQREHITRLITVPSLADALLDDIQSSQCLRHLRHWTLSGEELKGELLQKLKERLPSCIFVNLYGSSEVAADVTYHVCQNTAYQKVPIGTPIANTQIYILNNHLQPVPIEAVGEIYVGGVGVARGYLNRPDLTRERFIDDPFCPEHRMRIYKTGDLGRWRADGSVEYLGRNDSQVKIRGHRVELGEVEAQIARLAQVRQAAVVALDDAHGHKYLVAYLTYRGQTDPNLEDLRAHLRTVLPMYMVPSAFVILESFPVTPNGKLDRRALPAPELGSGISRQYEAPQGEVEETLAKIWHELLRIERVGRQDNFFELGGHSLLIVNMLERLRQAGLFARVHSVYANPKLNDLARALKDEAVNEFVVAPNLIPAGCKTITPEMLPLVTLEAEQIERIARNVLGGAENIQDIYPLTPLQEGMLFHHVLDEHRGDTYVLQTVLSVSSRERVEELIAALQSAIDRHDILRTAILWEHLPHPVQVVYRHALLPVEETVLDRDRDSTEQITEMIQPERQQMNIRQAPLLRLQVAADTQSAQWYALVRMHHMIDDDTSLKILISEIVADLEGRAEELPEPVPYRNHVAQVLANAPMHRAESFFHSRLGEIQEPTAPFGLMDVHGDGTRIHEAQQELDSDLAQRLRVQAQRLCVSVATLFHAAWALVIARTSGQDDVVFGSVLLGRMQGSAGAKRTVGMFINTLPLRLRLRDVTATALVEQTNRELVELLRHEQASLAMAQRCSGISGSAPLFSAVLNYRHEVVDSVAQWDSAAGIRVLMHKYRTNYPVGLSVDDLGVSFALTAQTERRIDPHRIIGYVNTAMHSLVEASERESRTPALALEILPENERHQVLELFNEAEAAFPHEKLLHELFEQQVERTPHTIALVYETQSLTYAELNHRSNQLAWHLRDRGIGPDKLVGIFIERSLEMVVGMLGILKAGGAYVPLDPDYPTQRLVSMLDDAAPKVLLIQERLRGRLPDTAAEVIALDTQWNAISERHTSNLACGEIGLRSGHLAYVIYTSGTTGRPKGVMVEHRNVASLWQGLEHIYRRSSSCQRIAVNASFNFDASVKQFVQLLSGRTIILIPQESRYDASMLLDFIGKSRIHAIDCTPSQLKSWIAAGLLESNRHQLKVVLVGGDAIDPELWSKLAQSSAIEFYNVYGPTESTVDTTFARLKGDNTAPHIGRPMENRCVHILSSSGQLFPIGVAGEIYIGGAGVARGYLKQPVLTAERFVPDPFSANPQARLYRTGDLGRWRADGTIEYIGRTDQQVKIRGFRIELGEIEARLLEHSHVRDAVVLAREDEFGERRLLAYVAVDLPQLKVRCEEASNDAGGDMVAQWKRVHDETYSKGVVGPSFVGWNSSYTGDPIPEVQMQEWLDCTVERVKRLRPKKVLEIGCGVGLLLQHLAPRCAVYVGTDFAVSALKSLRQWMSEREELRHVELLHRSATELQDLKSSSFDTLVLNSVVQYFPDIDYLFSVLQEGVRLLSPSGKIFIGDVRHLGLLPMFHSAVQVSKAGATVKVGQLKRRIARAIVQDKELVIDPHFFRSLPGHLAGISAAEVRLKRGRAANELTRYRYDVVLHVGEQISNCAVCETVDWRTSVGSITALKAALAARRWCAVRLKSVPNGRLAKDALAQFLIETSDERCEVSALRRQLNERQSDEIDPEQFWELGEALGYDVQVSWDAQDPSGGLEVQLFDIARADQVTRVPPPLKSTVKPWSSFSNNPLENSYRQQLIPQLRDYLKDRVPEYMVPSAWMVLKQLPVTPNGKVDRRALPNPQERPEEMGEYIPPRTELERMLAEMWAQVLQLDQVGVKDNFFEIGGHSLLAMQAIVRIRSLLSIDMPLSELFAFPTIEQLSDRVDHFRQAQLLDEVDEGGEEMDELLETVAGIPESKVEELVRELRKRAKS